MADTKRIESHESPATLRSDASGGADLYHAIKHLPLDSVMRIAAGAEPPLAWSCEEDEASSRPTPVIPGPARRLTLGERLRAWVFGTAA